jgi:exopolysaccharide biosynthesis polyprenyl glycosylphosphotransferase
MLRRFGTNFAAASLVLDGVVVGIAFFTVEALRPSLAWLPFSQPIDDVSYWPVSLYLAVSLLWILVLCLSGTYDSRRAFTIGEQLRILAQGASLAGLASAGLLYLVQRDVSRWTFIVFVIVAFEFLVVWRVVAVLVFGAFRNPIRSNRRVLIVGAGPVGQHIARVVEFNHRNGLDFVGYVDDDRPEGMTATPVLGTTADLRTVVRTRRVDEVIVVPPHTLSQLDETLDSLLDLAVHVRVVPASFAHFPHRATLDDLGGVPMIDLRAGPLSEGQRVVKRLLDLLLATALLAVTLPLIGIIAILIKCTSPGSPLFRQYRVGENGRIFVMYKFRTMIDGADKLQDLVNRWGPEGRLVHKHASDPRVTRLGKFLRETSLDELPQFLNVLKGDMSMVGPRPELPWIVAEYAPWQRRRLLVPQGLTGWWQVNGRANRTMHLHTDDDLFYVGNYSLWLDLEILLRTLKVVLVRTGAH